MTDQRERVARAIYNALRPSGDFPAIESAYDGDAYDAADAVIGCLNDGRQEEAPNASNQDR